MVTVLQTLKKRNLFYEVSSAIAIAFCGSVVISLAAPFSFFLPFISVPITLQVHVALFVAFSLGRTRGALAVAFFLMQGCMGFPVVGSGAIGSVVVLGPTSGYLVGYFIAALVMGSLKKDTFLKTFYVLAIGNLTIYLFGGMWLSGFIGAEKAFTLGVLPFLFTDYIKLIFIAKLAGLARGYPIKQ